MRRYLPAVVVAVFLLLVAIWLMRAPVPEPAARPVAMPTTPTAPTVRLPPSVVEQDEDDPLDRNIVSELETPPPAPSPPGAMIALHCEIRFEGPEPTGATGLVIAHGMHRRDVPLSSRLGLDIFVPPPPEDEVQVSLVDGYHSARSRTEPDGDGARCVEPLVFVPHDGRITVTVQGAEGMMLVEGCGEVPELVGRKHEVSWTTSQGRCALRVTRMFSAEAMWVGPWHDVVVGKDTHVTLDAPEGQPGTLSVRFMPTGDALRVLPKPGGTLPEGLLPDDLVIAIDGVSAGDMDASAIFGGGTGPLDEPVLLEIDRDGEIIEVELEREPLE